jgi:predicted transcriptional regulator
MPRLPRIADYVPSSRTVHAVWAVTAAVLALVMAWLVWTVASTSERLDDADAGRTAREAQVVDLQAEQQRLLEAAQNNAEAAAALARQVRELGEQPVTVPPSTTEYGPPGPPGPAPSAAQVQAAVDAFCAGGRCDGRNPTASQVASAVAVYCDNRAECRGPAGVDGRDGAPGEDGAPGSDGADGVDGRDAPPPTQAQVDRAVADYCDARGGCRGPKGDTGDRGPAGADGSNGRGVTSVSCSGPPTTFTFTYSDGASETVTCSPG